MWDNPEKKNVGVTNKQGSRLLNDEILRKRDDDSMKYRNKWREIWWNIREIKLRSQWNADMLENMINQWNTNNKDERDQNDERTEKS